MDETHCGLRLGNPVPVGMKIDLDLPSEDAVQQHLMRTMLDVVSARVSEETYLGRLRCPGGTPVRFELVENIKGLHGKPMGRFDIRCLCGKHQATVFLDGHTVGPDEPVAIPGWQVGARTKTVTVQADNKKDVIRQLEAKGIARTEIVAMCIARPQQSKTAEAEGADAAAAIEAARSKIEPDAFSIGEPRVVREKESGSTHVEADSEFAAKFSWRLSAAPDIVVVSAVEVKKPRKGILGVGKSSGVWELRWEKPCKVAIAYELPCQVQAYVLE